MSHSQLIKNMLNKVLVDPDCNDRIKTHVELVLQLMDENPEETVRKESKKKNYGVEPFEGKWVLTAVKKSPGDGYSIAEIYDEMVKMGAPVGARRELTEVRIKRRLEKDSGTYRMLENEKWVPRKRKPIIPVAA